MASHFSRRISTSLIERMTLGLFVGLMATVGCGDNDSLGTAGAAGVAGESAGASATVGGSTVGGAGGVTEPAAGSSPTGSGGLLIVGGSPSLEAAGASGVATAGTPAGGGSGAPSNPCPEGVVTAPEGVDCCPNDPKKTSPGQCGCGNPDENDCLVHRYSFDVATDGVVQDLAGDAPATVVKGSVSNGAANLAGFNSDEYVALPGGALSHLSSSTIETWVIWDGADGDWQRIFDFGDSSSGAGQGAEGQTYLFVTPRAGGAGGGGLRIAYTLGGNGAETTVDGNQPMPINTLTHVGVVLDSVKHELSLYLNGSLQNTRDWYGTVGAINDVNDWLGRSQYAADPEFGGKISEFRIYSAPRTPEQLLASYGAGPDVLPNEIGAGGAGGAGSEAAGAAGE